jgi:uncharacterized protein (DUF433 family)
MKRKMLGKHVVIDPDICHGKPTFVRTRIMAFQVLRQLASGLTLDQIVEEWEGRVPREAIQETLRLARRAFEDHAGDYSEESPTT